MRSYILKIFAGASVSIIIGLYALNVLRIENVASLESMYIIGYGGLFTFDFDHNFLGFLRVLVPQFILVYLLADCMYNDFKIYSVYVFTRENKRKRWFVNKCFFLLFLTAVYYLSQFLIILAMGVFNGLRPISFEVFMTVAISCFVLLTLTGFLLVISANLLALKIGINFGYLFVIILNTAMVMVPSVIYGSYDNIIIKLLPGSSAMFLWHSDGFIAMFSERFGFDSIEGFSLAFSIIYISVLIVITFFVGVKFIENLDILNDKKEA